MDRHKNPRDGSAERRFVFVRPGTLVLQRPGDVPSRHGAGAAARDPEADRALRALDELGFTVRITEADETPAAIEAHDWLLTDSVDDCRWARQAMVRTVLVGGPSSAASMPERCDRSVSDVYSAALEVLMADPRQTGPSDASDA